MRRFAVRLVLAGLCLIIGLVLLQQPWRRTGALHIVTTRSFSGTIVKIVQAHDGYGLNSTYLVAGAKDGKWYWFSIGYDDPYWLTMGMTQLPNGSVQLSKFGFRGPTFDPKTLILVRGGQTGWLSKVTNEAPN